MSTLPPLLKTIGNPSPGRLLKGARVKEGLTQQQVADKTCIYRHHMETGKRTIGMENSKKLAKALKSDYLIFL